MSANEVVHAGMRIVCGSTWRNVATGEHGHVLRIEPDSGLLVYCGPKCDMSVFSFSEFLDQFMPRRPVPTGLGTN